MPNWCEGDLKVRGSKDKLIKFIKEGLKPSGCWGIVKEEVQYGGEWGSFSAKLKNSIFYIDGTRRQFIDSNEINIWFDDGCLEDEQVMVLENFKSAWGVDVSGLRDVSNKFDIDFKILGFELGQRFNHDVEIIKGEIVRNREIHFDDYDWECIRPHIGG